VGVRLAHHPPAGLQIYGGDLIIHPGEGPRIASLTGGDQSSAGLLQRLVRCNPGC